MSDIVECVRAALRAFDAGWLLDTGSVNPAGASYETAKARAAIAAYEAAFAEAGYVIVPKEPTDAMLDTGYYRSGPIDGAIAYGVVDEIWRAMVAAAPTPTDRSESGSSTVG